MQDLGFLITNSQKKQRLSSGARVDSSLWWPNPKISVEAPTHFNGYVCAVFERRNSKLTRYAAKQLSDTIDFAVKAGAKGIVSAGVGEGSLRNEMEQGYIRAQKQGAVIVRNSRTGSGSVLRNEGAINDDQDNFVVADNLNPQKARVLLMLALTKTSDLKEIQKWFMEY